MLTYKAKAVINGKELSGLYFITKTFTKYFIDDETKTMHRAFDTRDVKIIERLKEEKI